MTEAILSLHVEELACIRGAVPVFAGVSFRLYAGGVMVVRGPNGSGKSSLLRILAGLVRPASGRVAFYRGEAEVGRADTAQSIHLVGHHGALTDSLSTEENLRFQTALLGVNASGIHRVLERVGLSELARQSARTLSAGQRRRLALARLLTVPRPVWLLDEPSEGLDTSGEALLAALLTEQKGRGGIVVIATHANTVRDPDIELSLLPAESEVE